MTGVYPTSVQNLEVSRLASSALLFCPPVRLLANSPPQAAAVTTERRTIGPGASDDHVMVAGMIHGVERID